MIEWSSEQQAMRVLLRKFVVDEIEPHRAALESGEMTPYGVLRKLYETFGMDDVAIDRFTRSMGGTKDSGPRRRDPEQVAMVLLPMVELARCAPGLVTAMGVSANLTPGAIMKSGTAEQKKRWALDLMTLRKVGAWAITEPGSGSDAFGAMKSTARMEGDEFVLNGSKTFITNGPYADTIVFICRLVTPDSDARPVVTFVLDAGSEGLHLSAPFKKMGMHSSPTGDLSLSEVRVGRDHFLGGEAALAALLDGSRTSKRSGGGSKSGARGAFASERASIAAMALGIIERCLELSVEYARTRVQFGSRIGDFQLIQEKLARMEVARLNVQNLLFYYIESLTAGRGVSFAEASAMKLYSARAALETALEAVQIHGGYGYMAEYHVEQLARDAKVLQIYAGTDEMQIRGIAKELLGATD